MRSIADKYSMVPGIGVVVFDPIMLAAGGLAAATSVGGLTATSMGLTAVGGGLAAASTLAGGNFAKTAGQMQQNAANFQAAQLDQNAGQAIASSQRTMLDTQEKTRLAMSASRARAGVSGVDAGVGSPAENEGELAQRGSYHALMDIFNGKSAATGIENQAAGARYTGTLDEMGGEEAQSASELAAAGTLAGSAGSMASRYGAFKYPTAAGRAGVSL